MGAMTSVGAETSASIPSSSALDALPQNCSLPSLRERFGAGEGRWSGAPQITIERTRSGKSAAVARACDAALPMPMRLIEPIPNSRRKATRSLAIASSVCVRGRWLPTCEIDRKPPVDDPVIPQPIRPSLPGVHRVGGAMQNEDGLILDARPRGDMDFEPGLVLIAFDIRHDPRLPHFLMFRAVGKARRSAISAEPTGRCTRWFGPDQLRRELLHPAAA